MQELVPITLFICFAYGIQAIVDARARSKLVAPHVSEEVLVSLIRAEQLRRRASSLRWGVTLVTGASGLAILQVLGWEDLSPGFMAVIVGAIGVGQLLHYFLVFRHPIAQ